ncbi:uncharacterized protein LOC125802971 [Astyanax mexicanus]|uniref:uncharacterized protein LOC125802971 n=1 Tax=Astyanax mexicanus TaxID=7994 RepID=UPI0020CAD0A2|nr:uncharacterized protein LOC125802971 [Astyanax mexicanus]
MTSTLTFEFQPDIEGILSVKSELKEKDCEDKVLLSNLDYAESIFRNSLLSSSMRLVVVGEWQCVRIGTADDLIYTVVLEGGHVHLDSYIYCSDYVGESDIQSIHFSMHCCQNEAKSCFQQAKEAAKASKVQALKIVCNRFSVLYTSTNSPEKIVTIKTKCEFTFSFITVEGLLKRKCWMEKEMANRKVLLAGIEHLIKMFLTLPNPPKYNCKFIIQGDGEMIEISTSNKSQEYIILMDSESQKVSMYPSSWYKS